MDSAGDTVAAAGGHNHPSYGRLAFLAFQAIFQVFLICLFGVWASYTKLMNVSLQRKLSQLNINLFTPCLIFTKLASSITPDTLTDLSVIPVLFVLTTAVSYGCARLVATVSRLDKRESNFVIAMGVFANSNSLPVSLTIALAQTLPALKWSAVPGDTPATIASRGILYLLIFQQLGQVLRWSWGYNTLLARQDAPESRRSSFSVVEDRSPFLDSPMDEREPYVNESISLNSKSLLPRDYYAHGAEPDLTGSDDDTTGVQETDVLLPGSSRESSRSSSTSTLSLLRTITHDSQHRHASRGTLPSFNRYHQPAAPARRSAAGRAWAAVRPRLRAFGAGLWAFMNPPLWAMLVSVSVALIPNLQDVLFNDRGTFLRATATEAVIQLGEISVPLTLVVLGASLIPDADTPAPSANSRKIVTAAIVSRMILPGLILLPLLTLFAKFVKLSIMADPIFIVVLFLLACAPPAIQLSQICQLNEVFEREMTSVLIWGYAILTLPVTMLMVVLSLEVLEWSGGLPTPA
ncbi:auxin efflux carrier [Dipodascopsis tothii]|uniref:auxin efflux carrier n=1 Tax=Dipodascopsis tothii TaxID=44089 RepID=UPI0034CFB455